MNFIRRFCCYSTATIPGWKDTIPFVPPISGGRVIKVYDGDTITIASKLPGLKHSPIYKFSVRLNGIDTPEMRGKNDDEKEMAHKARDALSERIFGKDVFLKNVQTEKYGRLLCDVYLENENLNQWMIEKRYVNNNGLTILKRID